MSALRIDVGCLLDRLAQVRTPLVNLMCSFAACLALRRSAKRLQWIAIDLLLFEVRMCHRRGGWRWRDGSE